MEEEILLKMRGIQKLFPGVHALDNVDFNLRAGEIHALLGENGAGKSTLIKVLTGVYPKDGGHIYLNGEEVNIHSPEEAQDHGIATVYQEVMLCPNLTVAENIYIGRGKSKVMNWRKMNKSADALLKSLGIPAKATQQLGTCSLATQQMVAIARAVDTDCKVLILDEPTSSLDEQEVEKLFVLMRDLRDKGVGIIFVTHFLDQVYAVCDRITVMRNGQLAGEFKTEELPRFKLVSTMLGKDMDDLADIKGDYQTYQREEGTPPVFEFEGLTSSEGIGPFNFHVDKGEVTGFTGLLGSGRSESVRAIFAADRVTGGKVKKNGKQVHIRKPINAMKLGIGYLPEDRKQDGIAGDMSVRDNILLAQTALRGFMRPYSKAEAQKLADQYIKLLSIKTASADTPISSLSGGNQQKVIVARWLLTHPDYLILDEPTRGIDIGTKTEIQKLVLQLASEGVSVTFISSEMDEMLRVCSRMEIMRDFKNVGEVTGSDLNQTTIMSMIAGGDEE